MDAGNEVRERLNSQDALALLSIGMIREISSNITKDSLIRPDTHPTRG
jgi:hypothetical protein